MLGRDRLAQRASGLRVRELACLPVAEREPVGVARLRPQNVEAPGLREAVVGRQDGGGEQGFDLLAGNGSVRELPDRAPILDEGGNVHAWKVDAVRPPWLRRVAAVPGALRASSSAAGTRGR